MTIRDARSLSPPSGPPNGPKTSSSSPPSIFSKKVFDVPLSSGRWPRSASSASCRGRIYLVNDVLDVDEDRLHPRKSRRPIAAGRIGRSGALALAACPRGGQPRRGRPARALPFSRSAAIYVLLQLAYSLKLKHVVILDVFVVALGFVLRVVAGGLVIGVPLSPWLLICTTLLALFIAMSKRRHELVLLEGDAARHRPILGEYSALPARPDDLGRDRLDGDRLLPVHRLGGDRAEVRDVDHLIYTAALRALRHLPLSVSVHQKDQGGSPEELILKDKPLLSGDRPVDRPIVDDHLSISKLSRRADPWAGQFRLNPGRSAGSSARARGGRRSSPGGSFGPT